MTKNMTTNTKMMQKIAELSLTKRYLQQLLLNIDVEATETSVSTLMVMLDHFIENPNDYYEFIRRSKSTDLGLT